LPSAERRSLAPARGARLWTTRRRYGTVTKTVRRGWNSRRVASYGDSRRRHGRVTRSHLLIYPFSLAIYCTSWTFFGSVGLASRSGYDFLTI